MYKKQMLFQRIICYALLIAAVLVFVYSLGIMTNLYDALYLYSEDPENPVVQGAEVYIHMQPFNRQLTAAGIALILSAVALFVTNTHKRRKYYIGNYVTVDINAVLTVVTSVWALINVAEYKEAFLKVDFEALKAESQIFKTLYTESTFWFDISVPVFAILLLVTALSIGNLVFKILLMRGEKRLLEQSGQISTEVTE
nr:hypothetical protein [Clostridia bacterium]